MNIETAAILVSPRDAAKLLSVSPRKLWDLTFASGGGLPYVRLGRLVRYNVADVQAWLATQSQTGKGGAR